MAINKLHVKGYRSIRDVYLELKPINVVLGANGTGKSNLYRSLYLIWAAADGTLARAIADEGGMPSALWAGNLRKQENPEMSIEVEVDDLTYRLVLGKVPFSDRQGVNLNVQGGDAMRYFYNDPDIKIEEITVDYRGKIISILDRKRGAITARNMDGRPIEYPLAVAPCESVLAGLREPHLFPDLSKLRSEILSWRLYHTFCTDTQSLLRQPQIPVFTPIMSHNGSDLVSALATIMAVDGAQSIQEAVRDAFPGASLDLDEEDGVLEILMEMPEFNRAFTTSELSDGTLQYLCLLAALLSSRPPTLLALNEPETSIHPDLYPAVAKLIVAAGKRSQLWITTHSADLARHIHKLSGTKPIELEKVAGATGIIGARLSKEDDNV